MVKLLKIPEPKSEIPNVFSKNLQGEKPRKTEIQKISKTREGRFKNPAIDLFCQESENNVFTYT